MKKNKIIYIIIFIVMLYTVLYNYNNKTITINNKKYFGQKYLRASDTIKVSSNRLKAAFENTDKELSYPIIQEQTDNLEQVIEYRYLTSQAENYIYFNCTEEDTSTCERWRIIGTFYVEDENENYSYRLKIIRNESIGKMSFDNNRADFESSNIKKYLNDEYYYSLSNSAQNMIGNTRFYTSGDNLSNYDGQLLYKRERSNNSNRSTEFVGKVGLIYPSDFLYTYYNSDNNCFKNLGYCTNKNASWMYNFGNNQFWTLTPVVGTNQIYSISNNSNIDKSNITDSLDIYPVVYLKYDTIFSSGDGTYENPYQIRSLNNSEIQNESSMNTEGLDKSNVSVDDTLSNPSILIIVISILFTIIGGMILLKQIINKKKNI